MADAADVAAAAADSLARISADLRFIWSERDVSDAQQQILSAAGFTSVGIWQAAADDRASLRLILKAMLGDPAEGGIANDEKIRRTVTIARLVESWETAKTRVEEAAKLSAEQAAARLPRTIARSTMIQLRQRFERDYGRVLDRSFPCQALVERRFEEVEEGEVRADALTDVASVEEAAKDDVMGAQLDKDGTFKLRRTTSKVPLPVTTEQLRNRVKMLGVTFQLAALRHNTRLWLRDVTPEVWLSHLEYVLGEDVAQFEQLVLDVKVKPPWNVVLTYEYQIRKEACRLVLFDGATLGMAMKTARESTSVKEKYFSTPTNCAAAVAIAQGDAGRKRPWEGAQGDGSRKGDPGGKGGKAAAKGGQSSWKGKGSKGPGRDPPPPPAGGQPRGHQRTPDGRSICYRFQRGKCSAGKKCNYAHVCQFCLSENHSGNSCKEAPAENKVGGKAA